MHDVNWAVTSRWQFHLPTPWRISARLAPAHSMDRGREVKGGEGMGGLGEERGGRGGQRRKDGQADNEMKRERQTQKGKEKEHRERVWVGGWVSK